MSERTISRARAWQLRKLAEGLCEKCGRAPRVNATHCEPCRKKHADRQLRYYHENRKLSLDSAVKLA